MPNLVQQATLDPLPPIPPLPSGPTGGDAVTGVAVQPGPIVQVSPDIPPEVVPIMAIVFGSVALMVIRCGVLASILA